MSEPLATRVALAITAVLLVSATLGTSTAAATHLADTGNPGGPTTPWGFNEGWGFRPGSWNADLATEQLELAGTIIPDSLSANRLHVNWREVEFTQDQYDWTKTDHVYQAMRASSDRPVMLIFQAPEWARDPAATCPAEPAPCAFPPAPQHDSEWSEFVEDAAARYPEVRAIEVYNEPNLARFWAPAPDPARYAEVLALAHDAAVAAGSAAPVITGGLSPVRNTAATRTSSREFLREIYNQGCACDFEGIGTHSYPRTEPLVDEMWRELNRLFEVRDNKGDPGTPLWITEVAVSSDATEGVGLERQGEELVRLYRSIEGHEIGSFIVHRLHSVTDDSPYWNHTGVVDENLVPKPAYCELGWVIGDPTCPASPAITGTDPASPSGNNRPRVKGTVGFGDPTQVKLYKSPDCSGGVVATATVFEFTGAGIRVTVATDATTEISARAFDAGGDPSGCSNSIAYVEDSTPPAPPTLTGTIPASPANDRNPEVQGTVGSGDPTQVKLYAGTTCAGSVKATGTPAQLTGAGITVKVANGSTTEISARAFDAAGNKSPCSNSIAYVELP